MISSLLAAKAAPPAPRPSLFAKSEAAADLPSAKETRRRTQDLHKEMASRRLQAVQERMKALSLMMKIDPRAALKMAAELAKELKSAVKAYQDAGGRNVGAGDMALIRGQLNDAREARDASTEAVGEGASPDVSADAETRCALKTYAAALAETPDQAIERPTEVEAIAAGDQGFFDRVKGLVQGLRKAHDDIRANAAFALSKPTDDEWKEAEKAQADLERDVATAPSMSGASVSITA